VGGAAVNGAVAGTAGGLVDDVSSAEATVVGGMQGCVSTSTGQALPPFNVGDTIFLDRIS
jgi:hypothetical protein